MDAQLTYVKLTPCDKDIPLLLEIHNLPQIARFVSIDDTNYFRYVTSTENVYYFKVMFKSRIVATVHIEKQNDLLFLSIITLPEHQMNGYGTQIVEDIKSKKLVQGFSKIKVYIDQENTPSIHLFEQAGFTSSRKEDCLLEYEWRT